MKKIILNIIIILFGVGCLSACGEPSPDNEIEVSSVYISIESQNEILVESYTMLLTNLNGDGSTLILATGSDNGEYNNQHILLSDNQYEHLVESDVGQVSIQLDFYLKIKYEDEIIPYIISLSGDYYTKSSDGEIKLYSDKKCKNLATFDTVVDNVKYNSGMIYSDNYSIDLKIYY